MRCEDARRMAREALSPHEVGERLLDDVLLVVSELVSNAVRHAGGVTGFRIRQLPDAVAVEVSDGASIAPRTPGTPAEAPGGFGWMLVNRIAQRTEIRSGRGGKTITAFLARTAAAPAM
ncbi:ATP-binding protein [Streptomyces avidinii]